MTRVAEATPEYARPAWQLLANSGGKFAVAVNVNVLKLVLQSFIVRLGRKSIAAVISCMVLTR